jgi:hypothetical protein
MRGCLDWGLIRPKFAIKTGLARTAEKSGRRGLVRARVLSAVGADPPIWQAMAAATPASQPFMHVSRPQQSTLAINTWKKKTKWLAVLACAKYIDDKLWLLSRHHNVRGILFSLQLLARSVGRLHVWTCVSGLLSRSNLAEKHAVVKQVCQAVPPPMGR